MTQDELLKSINGLEQQYIQEHTHGLKVGDIGICVSKPNLIHVIENGGTYVQGIKTKITRFKTNLWSIELDEFCSNNTSKNVVIEGFTRCFEYDFDKEKRCYTITNALCKQEYPQCGWLDDAIFIKNGFGYDLNDLAKEPIQIPSNVIVNHFPYGSGFIQDVYRDFHSVFTKGLGCYLPKQDKCVKTFDLNTPFYTEKWQKECLGFYPYIK